MMKLDIRTKIIILLTVSICTFIVNTLWIEVFFMIALSVRSNSFGDCCPIQNNDPVVNGHLFNCKDNKSK